jgi:hypothetical protein
MYPQESDTIPTILVGESRLLELISTNAPLAEVLDRICASLDVQVGNVVSMVLCSQDDEHSLKEFAEQAVHFGLYVFCCSAILSKTEELLGTLETFICIPRTPTANEARLIQRASQLAAFAIQRHERKRDPWCFTSRWTSTTKQNSYKGYRSEN